MTQRVRIVSDGPTWATAQVLVDGVPLDNVISVRVDIKVNQPNTAILELDCIEVDVDAEVVDPRAGVEASLDTLRGWGEDIRFQVDGDQLVAVLNKHKRDRGL